MKFVENVEKEKIDKIEIISISEKIHTRRIKLIWKILYSQLTVKFICVNGEWDKSMHSRFFQSDLNWLIGNIFHYILVFIFRKKIRYLGHSGKQKGGAF